MDNSFNNWHHGKINIIDKQERRKKKDASAYLHSLDSVILDG